MNPELQSLFSRLEHERQKLMAEVSRVSAERYAMNTRGKWSIGQILTHMLTVERLSLTYMKKKALGIDQLKNSGWLEWLKLAFLKVSQRLPIKYSAPKVVVQHTPETLSPNDLEAQWSAFRQELKAFLESIEEKNLRKKIYKHATVGRFDVFQALAFLREHYHHHLPQIKRLL
ncbi:MAG: DinB family protein [Bacteroidota bacterium]